jgi:glyceraldehyde 3-phosphate dehydrogenase
VKKIRIGINGLGRIGRCVIRALYENNYDQEIEIVAVNAPSDTKAYVHLINYDSNHGKFATKAYEVDGNIKINDRIIYKTSFKKIEDINWQDFNVDIVLECSGKFNKRSEAIKHIEKNVKKVLVSAPCEEADVTAVYGVNHHEILNSHQVISIGSCTTNCLSPVAQILDEHLGIESGFVTTVHAYTSDQNILDNSHKDLRRARSCATSMIPTSTGAAKSIGLVLKNLAGKLDGAAIRVPVSNVSLIDFSLIAKKNTTVSEVNELFKQASANDKYKIIDYLEEKLVSIDINHSNFSAVFDPFETKVVDNKFVRVLAWYDNEWGFANRMLDLAKHVGKLC